MRLWPLKNVFKYISAEKEVEDRNQQLKCCSSSHIYTDDEWAFVFHVSNL